MADALQLKRGKYNRWKEINPIPAKAELCFIEDVQNHFYGDGKHRFTELKTYGHGASAYEIAVRNGFNGTESEWIESIHTAGLISEAQSGHFNNAGPGWNSVKFEVTFIEMPYLCLFPVNFEGTITQNNVTRSGFQYKLTSYETGERAPVAEPVLCSFFAVSPSNQAIACKIAEAAGLGSFAFKSIDDLIENATALQAVENTPDAMNIIYNSNTAAGKLIALKAGLNTRDFSNMYAICADRPAMNAVTGSSAAMEIIAKSEQAIYAINSSDMAIAKYIAKLADLNPEEFDAMEALVKNIGINHVIQNETAMAAMASSHLAMKVVAGDSLVVLGIVNDTIALRIILNSKPAMAALAASEIAMAALAASAVALAEIIKNQVALDAVYSSPVAMMHLAGNEAAVIAIINDTNALTCIVLSETAMKAIAQSETAMAVSMNNKISREAFFGSQFYVGQGIATYAKINNSTLIGLHNVSAIAASNVAMSAIAASAIALNACSASETAQNALLAKCQTWTKGGSGGWTNDTPLTGKKLIVRINQLSNPGWTNETGSTQWFKIDNDYFTMSTGTSNKFKVFPGSAVLDSTVRFLNNQTLTAYLYNPTEIKYMTIQ